MIFSNQEVYEMVKFLRESGCQVQCWNPKDGKGGRYSIELPDRRGITLLGRRELYLLWLGFETGKMEVKP